MRRTITLFCIETLAYSGLHRQLRSIDPSIHRYIYPSVHLCIHLSTHPPVHPPIHLSIYPSICLSTYPSIRPPIHRSIFRSMHQSINPSIHLYIYPSIHLHTSSCHTLTICRSPRGLETECGRRAMEGSACQDRGPASLSLCLSLSASRPRPRPLLLSFSLALFLSHTLSLFLSLPLSPCPPSVCPLFLTSATSNGASARWFEARSDQRQSCLPPTTSHSQRLSPTAASV